MNGLQWEAKSVCELQNRYDTLNVVIYLYRNSIYLKDVEMQPKLTEYENFLSKGEYLLTYIDIFQTVYYTG